jgi:hypothetical protein
VSTKPVPSNGCEWAKPIYVSRSDVLTDGTARQILAHDETYQEICGKPTKSQPPGATKSSAQK